MAEKQIQVEQIKFTNEISNLKINFFNSFALS